MIHHSHTQQEMAPTVLEILVGGKVVPDVVSCLPPSEQGNLGVGGGDRYDIIRDRYDIIRDRYGIIVMSKEVRLSLIPPHLGLNSSSTYSSSTLKLLVEMFPISSL